MCNIINNKFREIKTHGNTITDDMKILAYSNTGKNIKDCSEGDSKGGLPIIALKELAINYYNLTEQQVSLMSKSDICSHIQNAINKLSNNPIVNKHNKPNKDDTYEKKYNMLYPKDINLCLMAPVRGGLSYTDIKNVAVNNFGINIEHKVKSQLCKEIQAKLNENKFKTDNIDNTHNTIKTENNNIINDKVNNDDELDNKLYDNIKDVIDDKTDDIIDENSILDNEDYDNNEDNKDNDNNEENDANEENYNNNENKQRQYS